ncbi:MAG TPA: hypothetical protein VNC17_01345 [Thermoleophilaceae bacterium]|nr:hypothetical protein [Thermoleophilaceae bacterium]
MALAGDARAARRALDGGQPGGPTRELLTEIDAPVRDASSLSGDQTCVRAAHSAIASILPSSRWS